MVRCVAQLLALVLMACVGACAGRPSPATTQDSEPRRRGDSYYLSTCARCDRLLGTAGVAVDVTYQQRSLRFCCDDCVRKFNADPRGGVAHIDQVMTADQSPHYPANTSIVSGRALADRGVEFVWGNRLVRVANERERAEFLRDPERYVRLLDAEVISVQRPTYGMPERCPVQGDILESDEIVDFVVANRMVRVCCGRCMAVVKNRPYQYLALVDFANKEAAAKSGQEH